jgi:thiol-disulfide isomerase/thioredoxin
MNILNQFSYPLIGMGIFALSFIALTRFFRVRWYITTIAQLSIVVLFVSGFIWLRPGTGAVSDADAALAAIGNGQPTFVEFFSNYCSGCLAFSSTIDALEDDISDEFDVLRIDIHTQAGRRLREELGFSFTPEYILYDPDGEEIWRDHIPPADSDIDRAR